MILCSLQLPLSTSLPGITQGIYDSVLQATDDEDQSESNIKELARLYRSVDSNCTDEVNLLRLCDDMT